MGKEYLTAPTDKSLFFYGSIYHRLLDPPLAESRNVTADLIPEGSSVLDIACGTGQLCFALSKYKHCRVIGIDLSLRMLEFARNFNFYQDVTFIHKDATDLRDFKDHSFDYATMLMVMHELSQTQQVRVFKEALRVAGKGIIIDSVAPLPNNSAGLGIRLVELTFGHDHNPNFKAFLSSGGIGNIIQQSGLPVKVEYTSLFWRNCREVFVVSTQ